jgi:hypothetical protein
LHDIVQKSFNLPIIHAQDLLPIWQALAVLQELISWAQISEHVGSCWCDVVTDVRMPLLLHQTREKVVF